MNQRCKFSCVIEDNPTLQAQTYIWLNCLHDLANVSYENIYIHTIGDFRNEFTCWFENLGVNRVIIKPFHKSNPYCNKLNQFNTFLERDDFDYVFLMDCDTAVVSLDCLELKEKVYAKIVDFPVPSFENISRIFSKAGVGKPVTASSSFKLSNVDITEHNNCNGGLYIVSKTIIPDLAKEWIFFCEWSLSNSHLYEEKYSKHIDQLSFSMALKKMNIDCTHLGIEWNYPTHINRKLLPDVSPKVLHFHSQLNEHLKLKQVGISNADVVIRKVNQVISTRNNTFFNNRLFWDLRYKSFPDLGSGIGSRGEILELKRQLLRCAFYESEHQSVLDVGCGDLEVLKVFSFRKYTGIDLSEAAINIAKKKRPDWNFECGNLDELTLEKANVVLCLDVLIHQPTFEKYRSLTNNLFTLCQDRLVVGAYNRRPEVSSEITFYYEPILQTIENSSLFSEVNIIGEYRDVSLIVATKSAGSSAHQRDISADDYNLATQYVSRGDLLRYMVDLSRDKIGFFTKHFTRTIEYTWLLDKVDNQLKDKRILDIGAGVSGVPIYLAQHKAKVVTIDYHKKTRTMKDKGDWNEWGFLDYSMIDNRIKSYNRNILDFWTVFNFDTIYSISVVEHVAQSDRVKIFKKISKILKRGGKLYLTIDIIPTTNNIWNYSEGKEVESTKCHGDIDSLQQELENYNFKVISRDVLRSIPNSRTDILFLEMVKG